MVISDVAPGGPAEEGRFLPKDVVTSVDGEPVFNLPGYAAALATHHLETPCAGTYCGAPATLVLSDLIPHPGAKPESCSWPFPPIPPLAPPDSGDLIHDLNYNPLVSVDHPRAGLARFQEGGQGVLTIERQGRMHCLGFEIP